MMLFGLYAMDGEVPFRTVMLHGLVRDKFGKKMSKSRGNTVDPLDWMDAYGSDALRFSLARGANPGADQPANEEWVGAARNFCNKLWNATRFAMLNGATVDGDLPTDLVRSTAGSSPAWTRSSAEVDAHIEAYEFAKATAALYHFVWDEFCDWYLELAKVALAGPGAPATRRVLGHVLDTVLRLLHPFVPFVTETLWTSLTGGESLVIAAWPTSDPSRRDAAAETEIASLQAVVTEVRRFRSDQGLRPGQRVPARVDGLVGAGLAAHEPAIRHARPARSAGRRLHADGHAGDRERRDRRTRSLRHDRRRGRDRAAEPGPVAAEKEKVQTAAKLGNADFLAKAPDAVVAKIRDRAAAADADIARITAQIAALAG